MKKSLFIIALLSVFAISFMNATEVESINGVSLIEFSDLEFSQDGNIETYDYATATCSEIRGGVRYSTTVGCFLCGEERASARCARVLSDRLNSLDPWVHFN